MPSKLARGRGRHHVDRAGHGILAEQDGLRAAQHLDALQVEERHARLVAATAIDAVQVEC